MSQENSTIRSALTPEKRAALLALKWHVENELEDMILETPMDRTAPPDLSSIHDKIENKIVVDSPKAAQQAAGIAPIGGAEAIILAKKSAESCQTLEELKVAIETFDGLSLKKTATNIVFSDGNQQSKIMVVGEAPIAEDDAQGKPFMGEEGLLLNKILASIGLARDSEDMSKAVYLSNILNWRPPGNRTPTPQEIEISLPFIKKHIELVKPDYLIVLGAVAAKAILERKDNISKIRGKFHEYDVSGTKIPTIGTYHPTYLLRTPAQKRAVWHDMLMLQKELTGNNA